MATAKKAKENEHLRYWDVLGKTDPNHTKPFSRAGGFKGTAMKPIWIIQKVTEQFGPIGIGWGTNKPEFTVVSAEKGETLVFCTVGVWIEVPDNLFYGVGGDKVVASRSSGHFNSDEAFKMAFTDAVNNALKYLGVGADIHMGQFDDSKYVQQMREEFEDKPECVENVEAFIDKIALATDEANLKSMFEDYAKDIDLANKTHGAIVAKAKTAYGNKLKQLRDEAKAAAENNTNSKEGAKTETVDA